MELPLVVMLKPKATNDFGSKVFILSVSEKYHLWERHVAYGCGLLGSLNLS